MLRTSQPINWFLVRSVIEKVTFGQWTPDDTVHTVPPSLSGTRRLGYVTYFSPGGHSCGGIQEWEVDPSSCSSLWLSFD